MTKISHVVKTEYLFAEGKNTVELYISEGGVLLEKRKDFFGNEFYSTDIKTFHNWQEIVRLLCNEINRLKNETKSE